MQCWWRTRVAPLEVLRRKRIFAEVYQHAFLKYAAVMLWVSHTFLKDGTAAKARFFSATESWECLFASEHS
eukprot:1155652-Pelagomonas_calceolata.AAC.4